MKFELKNLKKYRELNSLSQNDLADISNVSRSTIARIESGKMCNKTQVRRLSEALSVTIEMLACDNFSVAELTNYVDIDEHAPIIPASKTRARAPNQSTLTEEQKNRIRVIAKVFSQSIQDAEENWILDFSRDKDPEHEIKIFENMADAYIGFTCRWSLSLAQKKEVTYYLVQRSQNSRKQMKKFIWKHLSKTHLKDLGKRCKFRATPLILMNNEGEEITARVI